MNTAVIKELRGDELATAADANFIVHAGWVQKHVPGMRVVEEPDLVLVDSGLPCDTFNVVCRTRLEAPTALSRARQVIAYFRDAGRLFSWWCGPADRPDNLGEFLLAAGLEMAETELAMAADLAALWAAQPSPGGLEIQRVSTSDQLEDFARIIGATQGSPDPHVLRFYDLAAPTLLSGESPLWLYVGYLEEVPVATAEVTLGGGVAGLYNVSTLPAYRRRGYGTAITLRPLLDARAQGYRAAILQASAEGVSIYTRLGFEPFGQITEYKPPGAAAL